MPGDSLWLLLADESRIKWPPTTVGTPQHHSGVLSVEQGATVPVCLATLGDDGPTEEFITHSESPHGMVAPW